MILLARFCPCLVNPYSDRLLYFLLEKNWEKALKLIRKGEGIRWKSLGWNILHVALWELAPEFVILALIRHGISPNERDIEDGRGALHYAVLYHPTTVKTLVNLSAEVNSQDVILYYLFLIVY